MSANGKTYLAEMEQEEREATGIKNLKIGYNRVFGYYIEVTKSFYDLVPYSYTRKQTLANCERFITEELKELWRARFSAPRKTPRGWNTSCSAKFARQLKAALCRASAHGAARSRRWTRCCRWPRWRRKTNMCARPSTTRGATRSSDGRHPVVEESMAARECSCPTTPIWTRSTA